jgi:hydrogenase 3 maturation protease
VSGELNTLLSQKDKEILFAGIGNLLRSDDGVGVYISSKIKSRPFISSVSVEVSIENYVGKINSLKPDLLVLIDCIDMNTAPGTYKLFELKQIADFTFNTHNISLKRMHEFFDMPVLLLGIQPENIDFGEKLSYLVKSIADKIIYQINKKEVNYGSSVSLQSMQGSS